MADTKSESREGLLVDTFVELSDVLVDDFEPLVFLDGLVRRTVELDLASAAGVLLRDLDGSLRVMAASEERIQLLEMLQVQTHEGGPCVQCVESGVPVSIDDLEDHRSMWPRFVEAAGSLGLRSVHAIPLRLRDRVLGAMNLFHDATGRLTSSDRMVARGLAQVATIGLVQDRTLTESRRLSSQLQHALDSRVLVEQAKGMVAEQSGLAADDAFELIRGHARSHNRRVHDVAQQILDGDLAAEALRTG